MKYLILASSFLTLGLFLHDDKIDLIKQMQQTCSYSYTVPAAESDCKSLINRIQANDNLEVLSDSQGHYWIKANKGDVNGN